MGSIFSNISLCLSFFRTFHPVLGDYTNHSLVGGITNICFPIFLVPESMTELQKNKKS
jgi:hypothetical protein